MKPVPRLTVDRAAAGIVATAAAAEAAAAIAGRKVVQVRPEEGGFREAATLSDSRVVLIAGQRKIQIG
jgi:hypothetical protein